MAMNKRHFVVCWGIEKGLYLVGPFETSDLAYAWAVENQGTDVLWQVGHIDPTRPLPVKSPGTIPELAPDPHAPEPRWCPPQSGTGAFHLLMVEVPYFVGPFGSHCDAYAWGQAYQQRTDDENWWVVWLDDPTARPRLLTPEQGVTEAERSDAAWSVDPEIVEIYRRFAAAGTSGRYAE
jgi:hypothetical protein